MPSRRTFLASGAVLGAAGLYSYRRGLRFPRLGFEHRAQEPVHETPGAVFTLFNAITLKTVSGDAEFRAIAPEPVIKLALKRGKHRFNVNNLSANARLVIDGKGIKELDEQIDGINRTLNINAAIEQDITLSWHLDTHEGLDFAVMGDTGGGTELTWTIKRADELDAQFLLHLGDFNYGDEYDQAIAAFKDSPIPCYITIGNHDFNENGLVYQKFLDQLGPMNHAFEIAGTRFINVDTAVDFFPVHSGHRGRLFEQLEGSPFDGEQIFFTHRPLKDPRPGKRHDSGSDQEIAWLAESIKELKGKTLLTGHVHHSAELDFEGIRQFTVGEGLGHEDLVLQKPVAKIMMVRVQPYKSMQHSWVDLNMPWSEHQSHTHEHKLKRDGRLKQLEWYKQLIKS